MVCVSTESKNNKLKLTDRDYRVLREIGRWRIITSRTLIKITGFPSQRTGDRRLKKLMDAGYIDRQKILYGVPYLYFLTLKGKAFIGVSKHQEKIRIDQIRHGLAVVKTAIYFHDKLHIPYENMKTEKELHSLDGFSNRRHRPDLVFTDGTKNVCAEIELSLKAKERLKKNIKDNFISYDLQIWVVPYLQHKIAAILQEEQSAYTNIQILELKEIESHE